MANRLLRDWTGSEAVDQLSEGAEVFFTRLIMKADDFGCYYGNPKILSSTLYPLKKLAHDKIIKLREECARAGIVQVYSVDGKEYVHIPNFGQRLRAMNRKFPEPPKFSLPSGDGHMTAEDDSHEAAEEKGREEEEKKKLKGREDADAPFHGELLKKWFEWEQHRKEKRNPLTPTAREKQIKLLGGRPPNEAIAMIDHSLNNGYTGLFEPKTNGNRNANQGTAITTTAIIEPGKSFGVEKGFSRSGANGGGNGGSAKSGA